VQRADLLLESIDLGRQRAAALDQVACDPGDGALEAGEAFGEPSEVARVVERPRGGLVAGVEFVQVPAQPADHAGSFAYQVLAVVDEQTQLPLRPVELGDR
jgi:hypothetical protein